MKNIYEIDKRLERILKRIKNTKDISKKNKKLILKFHDDCFAKGLAIGRVLFYMNRFWNIGRLVKKDFDKMGAEDLKKLVREISKKKYSERTKIDHNISIKRFYKWLSGDEEYPKVKWINTTEHNQE